VKPAQGGFVSYEPGESTQAWRFVLCPAAAEGGGSMRRVQTDGISYRAGPWYPDVAVRERWGREDPERVAKKAAEWKRREEAAERRRRDEAGRRARRQVRQYCAANRLNRLGTLTYRGEGCFEPGELRADLAAFMKALRHRMGGQRFPYVWVAEWHPGGHGLHVHFAVGRYIPRGAIAEAWGRGFVSIKLLGDLRVGSGALAEARMAGRYLGKYVAKDFSGGGPAQEGKARSGLHRYEVAQGFQPAREEILGGTDVEVLHVAAELMGGWPARRWYSNETPGWLGPPSMWAAWDR